MSKLLGYIFSPLQYLAFGLCLLVFHPVQWLSLRLGGYSAHKRSVDILNYCLLSTYLLAGCRVKFHNKQQLPLNRSIIFVANHQSMYDISPLIWHLRKYHAKFISKIELTRGIPSISFNLIHGGGANIDRKDPKQSISEILRLAGRMRDNKWSAVIFPEGTRTKTGKMKPFAVGGVSTLLKKVPDALLVPIAITGSWELTRYGTYPLNFGTDITYVVLPPVEPAGRTAEEVIAEAEMVIKETVEGAA
jgi:1-acyl-sn-glycerol-3-phosphate acyltransferase